MSLYEHETSTVSAKILRPVLASLVLFGASVHIEACSSKQESCEPYSVFVQNRWPKYGGREHSSPDTKDSTVVRELEGNESIIVTGWKHAEQPYPNNVKPFNSDVWFKTDDNLWISYTAVRGEKTRQDPTGLQYGGKPAPAPPECEIK